MRATLLISWVFGSILAVARADDGDSNSDSLPLHFSGTGASETHWFNAQDRWELKWDGMGFPYSVTVETENGDPVAGSGGPNGLLYMVAGGRYKVRIAPNFTAMGQWKMDVLQMGPPHDKVQPGMEPTYVPPDMTMETDPHRFTPPENSGARTGTTHSLDVPSSVATAAAATNAPPAVPAVPPGPAAPPPKLTEEQAAAVVLVRGDNAEGTGFLVKTAAGSFVVTNQHVIAANPHIQITTNSGALVKISGLSGASDRDLAMIPVEDNNYHYLPLAGDLASSVQLGDDLVTPGNSQGGDVMLNTGGKVLGIGPQKIEISNPIYHGNSGGPIIDVRTGAVVGVVTEGLKVDTSNVLDKASFDSGHSAINGTMRYFGLRVDNVPTWEPYTWNRFENETEFLHEFDERNKSLDSYMNTTASDKTDWGLYYLRDPRVKQAIDDYNDVDRQSDVNQRLQAVRTLVFALDGVADLDMDQIQNPANFYGYDKIRARDEIAYRTWLSQEISNSRDNVERIGHLTRITDAPATDNNSGQ